MARERQVDGEDLVWRQAAKVRRGCQAIEIAVDMRQGQAVAVGLQDRHDTAEIDRYARWRPRPVGQGDPRQHARRGRRAGRRGRPIVEHLIADPQVGGDAVELGLGRLGAGGGGCQEREGGERDQAS